LQLAKHPKTGETLVRNVEEAEFLIREQEVTIQNKRLPRWVRADALRVKAVMYAALGRAEMLEAAKAFYDCTETADSCSLLAFAMFHHGRMPEFLKLTKQAYRLPHQPGLEIDLSYGSSLLYDPKRWLEAWEIIRNVKLRAVVNFKLPRWKGTPLKSWPGFESRISIIPEGGFGDILQYSRLFPLLRNLSIRPIVYVPDYFFDGGFVDLVRKQSWMPEFTNTKFLDPKVPAVSVFDLLAIFKITPATLPKMVPWSMEPEFYLLGRERSSRPRIGFCWGARALEAPLCEAGSFRSLTEVQARRIVDETAHRIDWVCLQYDRKIEFPADRMEFPEIKTWLQTASVIADLDAVVSVDTSVMHLAAAMGKKTMTLLSGASEWKFGLEGPSPWYPNMLLFRNGKFGFDHAVSSLITYLLELG
jgi:Glycosyltransferase family 9 (heptosyltransferase)